jgi:hypothetical protein
MTDFYDEQWAKRFFIHERAKERNASVPPSPDWINQIPTETIPQLMTKDAINPPHYQDIVPGMQYMEMMVFMLARFNGVDAHLMGQIYKYLMRAGMKDPIVQDLEKAQWYLNALINQLKTGDIV